MFKIIKSELFDSFHCLMGKCPDNCCNEDWNITVDDSTYELYKSLNIPSLNQKISETSPHKIIKCNGRCAFFRDDGLCNLHATYGEEALSNTCKSYPRFVSEYGDLYIETIGLSCPAASDWLLCLDHICKLIENIYYESESEVGNRPPVQEAETFMQEIISIFANNSSFYEAYSIYCKRLNTPNNLRFKYFKEEHLLLRNICIYFLFENIMLESKNASPNYEHVHKKLYSILTDVDSNCFSIAAKHGDCSPSDISQSIYLAMRKYDHIS